MSAEKWVLGVSSFVAASLTGYKAYDDYTKASASDQDAAKARAMMPQADPQSSQLLNSAANESDLAAASYRKAALVFGVGSLISASIGVYTLWPRKKR